MISLAGLNHKMTYIEDFLALTNPGTLVRWHLAKSANFMFVALFIAPFGMYGSDGVNWLVHRYPGMGGMGSK